MLQIGHATRLAAPRVYPPRPVRRLGPVSWIVVILSAGLLALLVYGVAGTGADDSLDQAVKNGERPAAPGGTVSLPTLDGSRRMSLADLRGEVVVLNFWASWCDPCKSEAPLLEKAQKRLRREGGTVFGVTYKDRASASRDFARRYGYSFPSVRDDELDLAPKFGTIRLPETFVLDRAGRVVAISRGEITDQRFLDRAIDAALKEPAA
jgi:cytochrome c biogenesis protein CcmG/thiol:disulfide interchange protein DsbE